MNDHEIDYSLFGLPQLPHGWFWVWNRGFNSDHSIRLPFFAMRIYWTSRRNRPKLGIHHGRVATGSYSGDSQPLDSAFCGTGIRSVRRVARRLYRANLTVDGKIKDPEPVVFKPHDIGEIINPISAYRATREAAADRG